MDETSFCFPYEGTSEHGIEGTVLHSQELHNPIHFQTSPTHCMKHACGISIRLPAHDTIGRDGFSYTDLHGIFWMSRALPVLLK